MFTRNYFRYNEQKHLYALYLMPEENEELMKLFPNRTPYIMLYDLQRQEFRIIPYRMLQHNALDYFFAGLNYMHGAGDSKKAEQCYLKGLSIDPENTTLLWEIAFLYETNKEYDKAFRIFERMRKVPIYEESSRYMMAKILGDMGKNNEAAAAFKEFLQNSKDPDLRDKAQKWLNYYKGK